MKGPFGFFKRRKEQRNELGKRYVEDQRRRELLEAAHRAGKQQAKRTGRIHHVNVREARVGLPGTRSTEKRERKQELTARRSMRLVRKHGRTTMTAR